MATDKDLKKIAAEFFDRYTKENKAFITSDGQVFVDEQFAKNHAKQKELDVDVFRRGDKSEATDIATLDRSGLEAYITTQGLTVEFTADTSDEDLRKLITDAIAAPVAKTTTKTAK